MSTRAHGGRKAVFLDLNGTLVLPLKQERLAELRPIPGAVDSVARLTAAGFVCPVVTVQNRIAKGLFTTEEFLEWFGDFAATVRRGGGELAGPYVCPHRYRDPCACRKPNALLYERATAELGIGLEDSFLVGDTPEDVHAAVAIGVRSCLVLTGWATDPQRSQGVAEATHVAPSIIEAVDWILARAPGRRP